MVFLIFIWIFFSLSPLGTDPSFHSQFIVWNVGQGQWLTWIHEDHCDHFDQGGEHSPISRVLKLCQYKKNRLFLSHGDSDHSRFIYSYAHAILSEQTSLCLMENPPFPVLLHLKKKLSFLKELRACKKSTKHSNETKDENRNDHRNDHRPENRNEKYSLIYPGRSFSKDLKELKPNLVNASSLVFLIKAQKNKGVLIPGDSPSKDEKIWATKIKNLPIEGLILGHHGSRTSTSQYLLNQLPKLKWAVASSKIGRYKHPHPLIVERLKKNKIPLLKTEDWGNLIFYE